MQEIFTTISFIFFAIVVFLSVPALVLYHRADKNKWNDAREYNRHLYDRMATTMIMEEQNGIWKQLR